MSENSIDIVMNMPPEELLTNTEALKTLIEYHRQQQANFEAGVKPKKEVGEVSITLETLGMKKPKEVKPMRRF